MLPAWLAAELSSAHAQAASLSEVAAAGEALRSELEAVLQDTQQQLAELTARLTDSNTVKMSLAARKGEGRGVTPVLLLC